MPMYRVHWRKTYYAFGTAEITAANESEAYKKAEEEVGDWEGSMQYCPDDSEIEFVEEAEEP